MQLPPPTAEPDRHSETSRRYLLERVDDAAVVQLYADGFRSLPRREKILAWHLYRAALAGRDIYYDQRYRHNLDMRETLEEILTHPTGIDPETLAEIHRYTKLFWINTGPYNNLTARKFIPACAPEAFDAAARAAGASGAAFPLREAETLDEWLARMRPLFFDPDHDPVVTSKTPGEGIDILEASANNLYLGVTMGDLEDFTERFPLNSRLEKQTGGVLVERVYKMDGVYGDQIAEIVRHLEAAIPYATDAMARALRALVTFYQTGETADRVAYDIAWVQDRESLVDTVNGFVEVYLDARGHKGAWEALVLHVNHEKTEEARRIADAAQWFEDHMPWDPKYRKPGVRGISATAMDVIIETGESGPVTPVGINLPNDQAIREQYGSKSLLLSNVVEAYDRSTPSEFRREFAWSDEEAARAERWSMFGSELHTNLHEIVGHGSGRVADHLNGAPQAVLKEQYSALEEARADLVALYFLPDPKLAELGIVRDTEQADLVLAEFEAYTRNALVQLRRVRHGSQIEEDHMRNRQMIVHWLMAHTSAIDVRRRHGKTYYVMTDSAAFRDGVARLLAQVQRIKGEGDYEEARSLFERYGVHFDPALRDEVVARVERLNMPSYTAFVQPRLETIVRENQIVDVAISYPMNLTAQMLEYSGKATGQSGPALTSPPGRAF